MIIEKLQYITNGSSEAEILEEVNAVVDAGCKWVQLRIKNEELDFLTIALKVKDICKNKAVFVINDKVSIAQQVDADGVHLGLEDMSIPDARKILGENKIIGGTANTIEDCLMHQNNGANYIGLGPFRMTVTKAKLSPILGLIGYQNILPKHDGIIKIPVVAIGGLVVKDLKELMGLTAVHGIAVSGLISNSNNKTNLISMIHETIGECESENSKTMTKEFSK